jgi:Flp pilus assembly protein TadB
MLEEGALAFFLTLDGYLKVGIALPNALFRLSNNTSNPFAVFLAGDLTRFYEGRPLSDCLFRFRKRSLLRQVGLYLVLLELAYRRGLSVGPLLQKALPALERDLQSGQTILQAQRSVLLPISVAAALPWVMMLALGWLQPELLQKVWQENGTLLRSVSLGALGFEAIGGIVVWKAGRFF